MRRFAYIVPAALLLFCSGNTRADWITNGYFSERAGIDSLERFLVLRDTTDSTYFGWNITPAGDINDDGISDVIIGRLNKPWSNHNSFLFYGGSPPETTYQQEFTGFNVHLQNISDINNDGYDDFAESDGIYRKAMIYYGGPLMDDLADVVISDVWTYFPKPVDLDNDGLLELPMSESLNGGSIKIYCICGEIDTIPEYIISDTTEGFGRRLATGDFNGDNNPDLVAACFYSLDSYFIRFYWGGNGFDTIPDLEIPGYGIGFGEFMQPLGDFNGDGYEDIFIAGNSPVRYGVYFGGPDIDAEMDIAINIDGYLNYYVPTSVDLAGDINNDGYPDLIIGRLLLYLSEIFIYLGGPEVDSIFDINIEDLEVPGPQEFFGHVVAGIGDFNGDNIDDFAVRSQTEPSVAWWSEVNFFAGWVSYICGDIDSDGPINMLDILYLISYLYKGGAAPGTPEGADVNNDNSVNMLDILYLIAYLYKGGPQPVCN